MFELSPGEMTRGGKTSFPFLSKFFPLICGATFMLFSGLLGALFFYQVDIGFVGIGVLDPAEELISMETSAEGEGERSSKQMGSTTSNGSGSRTLRCVMGLDPSRPIRMGQRVDLFFSSQGKACSTSIPGQVSAVGVLQSQEPDSGQLMMDIDVLEEELCRYGLVENLTGDRSLNLRCVVAHERLSEVVWTKVVDKIDFLRYSWSGLERKR